MKQALLYQGKLISIDQVSIGKSGIIGDSNLFYHNFALKGQNYGKTNLSRGLRPRKL